MKQKHVYLSFLFIGVIVLVYLLANRKPNQTSVVNQQLGNIVLPDFNDDFNIPQGLDLNINNKRFLSANCGCNSCYSHKDVTLAAKRLNNNPNGEIIIRNEQNNSQLVQFEQDLQELERKSYTFWNIN